MRKREPIRAPLIVVGCILVVTFALLYSIGKSQIASAKTMAGHEETIATFDRLLSAITDAETGQRGYLLVGERPYLQPYTLAKSSVSSLLLDARSVSRSNGVSPLDLMRLEGLVRDKFGELEETISAFDAHRDSAAFAIVRSDRGKRIMDEIRSEVRSIEIRQTALLQEATDRDAGLTNIRTAYFAAAMLLSIASLAWAYRRINLETSARRVAAEELEKQKQLLEVTLQSIGDGVIVTDAGGNVSFLNPVATSLTGWGSEEARGKPCHEVFVIINEDSRKPVESPVDKVIESGTIVGLANHTLLVRRDKSEIPIDDSGAPILDSDGNFYGVVLVFRDFSEHKQMQKTLRAAKEDAEAATAAKDKFLASLSHELRTPLTPVAATLSAWQLTGALPEAFRKDVEIMHRSVALETRLIDDLLDLTRIIQGKMSLNEETADVHELILRTTDMCMSEVRSHGVKLNLDLKADRHFVNGDPARLQQVIWNILRNAIKFTPEGGQITIETAEKGAREIQIQIRDTGSGMTPAVIESVFRPFEQGDSEVSRRYGGLGLGMAITQSLVKAHSGNIVALSEGPGKGSTFVVALPTVKDPIPASSVAAPTLTAEGEKRKLAILLVEDHEDSAFVLSTLLEATGHRVTVAASVAAALAVCAESHFDIVLCDLGLPDGSGIDFIRLYRPMAGGHVPAVALTGYGMDENIQESLSAGFTKHLTKPVDFQRLSLVIDQLTQRSGESPSRS